MARKREGKHDEVMLIPFLDILCSLIGVLVLIIVVVCVAQTQKVKGRTKEDLALAQRYQSLLAEQREQVKAAETLKEKIAAAEKKLLERAASGQKLQQDLLAKQQKLVELRRRLTLSAEAEQKNKEQAARLQKAVEDLLAQVETLGKELPLQQSELDKLRKLLAERQKKPDEKPPSVVVRPAGSGSGAGRAIFFVEASGGGIVIYKGKNERVRVAQASVGEDKDYNAFLQTVKNTGGASLVFLVRRDGWGAYQRAAGWAEQSFGLSAGKLPIPGDGPIDLSPFDKG
jgi:small-conductance mechanosensitive channel